MGSFEAQAGEFLGDSLGKFRDNPPALSGEFPANALEFGVDPAEFGLEAFQVGVALFEGLQFLPRLFAEFDDVGRARAVFALERLDEIEPIFEQLQAGRIGVQLVGVVR